MKANRDAATDHLGEGVILSDSLVEEDKVHDHKSPFQGSDLEAVQKRLSRIEGQIRGIKKMITEGRDCKDVVTQFAAVSRALEQAAFGLVTSQLTYCIEFPQEAKEAGYSVEEVKKLLSKLR